MTKIASDGLPARVGGPWTRENLTYLRKYAEAFMTAMAPKRREGKWNQLVYIDLLAGPGLGIDEQGKEFHGSPLIAMGVTPPFDQLFFSDSEASNIDALTRRIPTADKARVVCQVGDCSVLVRETVNQLSAKTLGLAFVDPEGFEVEFATIRALATRRIDILYLFPSGIGIRRNLPQFMQQRQSSMDDFWGDRTWRKLPLARREAGQLTSHEEMQLERSWASSFSKRVAALSLKHYDESPLGLRNNQNALMYHLLFFSHDAIGLRIWKNIGRIEPGGQRPLFKN